MTVQQKCATDGCETRMTVDALCCDRVYCGPCQHERRYPKLAKPSEPPTEHGLADAEYERDYRPTYPPTFAYSPDMTDEQRVRQVYPEAYQPVPGWCIHDRDPERRHLGCSWADARAKLPAAPPEATQEDAVWAMVHEHLPHGTGETTIRAIWPLLVELIEQRKTNQTLHELITRMSANTERNS